MTGFAWLAAIILFVQLPIPLYWFAIHPQIRFWRRHRKAVYVAGLLLSWPPVTAALVYFHSSLFCANQAPLWRIAVGLALLILEAWIFWRVHHDLGTARLVGKTEVSGEGQIAESGIYSYIRHPRYVGSFLAILGACLLAGTRVAWTVAAAWTLLMLGAIALEERELRARFGATYNEYCRKVPRFIPLRRVTH